MYKDFESYKEICFDEILPLQDEFTKLYDIESYEEWFYDHGTGAFQFKSDDGRILYFKYTKVGSFSTKANTWKWSWDNNNTPNLVKRRLEKVRAFGELHGFKQLTDGLFEGDDFTGWDMTVVAAKLLNAMGMYRVPQDNLFVYFIFTNELSQEQYEELKNKYVDCNKHGTDGVAFVCQHLLNANSKGFHEAFDSNLDIEPDEEYQAWCDECEIVRLREGGWNDESMEFANIKIICHQCYFELKEAKQTKFDNLQ